MMTDMGKKMSKEGMPVMQGEDKDKMMYPALHMEKIPDDLKDKDVGHICRMEILGKVVSKSERENGESMEIEVHKMGYLSKAGGKTFEEYDKSSKEEKEMHDKESAGVDEEEE